MTVGGRCPSTEALSTLSVIEPLARYGGSGGREHWDKSPAQWDEYRCGG